jgi:N-acetylneuraminic acid mutarotase
MVNESMYHDQEHQWSKYPQDLIYLFGGKDASGTSNRLYKLGYNRNTELPMRWEELTTKGVAPPPSYNSVMEYYNRLRALIVIGGRKDDLNDHEDLSVMSLVFIYYIRYSTWAMVEIKGTIKPMCSHSSSLYGPSKIVIFGGIGNQKYLEPFIQTIDLDPSIVTNKISRDRFQLKQASSDSPPHAHKPFQRWDQDSPPVHSKNK